MGTYSPFFNYGMSLVLGMGGVKNINNPKSFTVHYHGDSLATLWNCYGICARCLTKRACLRRKGYDRRWNWMRTRIIDQLSAIPEELEAKSISKKETPVETGVATKTNCL